MKASLLLISLLILYDIYSQELAFAVDGKKRNGFAHLDTVFKLTINAPNNKTPFLFKHLNKNEKILVIDRDTISLGNLLFSKSDSIEYFVLINTGDTAIAVIEQDWSLIAIKEAMNYKNIWQPIEFWNYSWCGNSYSDRVVLPGHILLMKTFRQFGSINTKLRLRLKTSTNGIIVSEPYEGNIDETYYILNSELEKYAPILKDRLNYLTN